MQTSRRNNKTDISQTVSELENISSIMADKISNGNYEVIPLMDKKRRSLIKLIYDRSNDISIKNSKKLKLVYSQNNC